MKFSFYSFLFALLLSCCGGSLLAATLTVTSTTDGAAGSLRDVLNNSVSGDIIEFAAGTNLTPQIINTPIDIVGKQLTITGNGINVTIIQGGGNQGIFTLTDATIFWSDMFIRGGLNEDGSGGAIFMDNTELSLTNVRFTANQSTVVNQGIILGGGAIYANSGTLNINGCAFIDNVASGDLASGGAICNPGSVITISDSNFSGNTAGVRGGAIATANAGTGLILLNSTFRNNECISATADGGGAVSAFNSPSTIIENCTFDENTSATNGGAIWSSDSNLRITNSDIENNVAQHGGGLYKAAGAAILRTTTVFDNSAITGGGLWNGPGLMGVNDSNVNGNTATGDNADQGGGGIFNAGGTLRISGSEINNNTALGISGSGGGIFNDTGGAVKIFNTFIESNLASRAGGGIEDNSGAGTKINLQGVFLGSNSTGPNPGNGGGLHVTGNGDIVFGNSVVFGNSATAEGGGLWNGTGNMRIVATNINNNTAGGSAADQGGGGIFNAGGFVFVRDGGMNANTATGSSGSGGAILNDAGGTTRTLRTNILNCTANTGGGIGNISGEVYFFRGVIESCSANTNGGGIHSTDFTRIIDAEVHFNTAIQGGGIWSGGDGFLDVYTSTIDFNELASVPNSIGGGVTQAGGESVFTMSTVANNSANQGGAIAVFSGSASLQSCTVARNSVNETNTAAGIALAPNAIATLASTVIALNNTTGGTPYDVSGMGMFQSKGYNFVGADDISGLIASAARNTDQFGTQAAPIDPNLDVLADNGGFTFTMAILCPSPLIDAGNPGYQDDDQADQPIFNGRKDIGAYEAQFGCPEPFAGDFEQLEIADETARTSVYPNPVTNGRATVQIPTAFGENVTLRVLDMAGMVMLERQAFAGTEELDLARLPKGTYTLQVISATTTESHRVIVNQ